jgi:N6-adenosine-specific RNA methylase IME4
MAGSSAVDDTQGQSGQELALLRRAEWALAEARSLQQVKSIRDQVEAVRTYVRSVRLALEIQNYAAEVKLRAERKAGRLLAECKLRGGDRRSKSHHATLNLRLSDVGITRDRSSRWQMEASVPDSEFERYVTHCQHFGKVLTSAALLRLARSGSKGKEENSGGQGESDLAGLAASFRDLVDRRQRFACIWANPPWSGNGLVSRKLFGAAYWADLRKLPVREIAAEQAHLHFGAPAEFLCDVMRVMEAWGFRYRSVLVLRRLPQGFGRYWRAGHEFLLLGVRGGLAFRDNSLVGQLEVEGCRVATCLDALRELIERVSPGPYLELFGQEPRPGWTVVGEGACERKLHASDRR